MDNIKVKHPRTWDTDDRVLQTLYGLALWDPETSYHPRFGAGITLPLRTRSLETLRKLTSDSDGNILPEEGSEQSTQETPPTLVKLAWHFGHMDWAVENVKSLIRKSRGAIQGSDIDERFFIAAERSATQEFINRRVCPLSRAALAHEYPCYVQSVPPRTVSVDLTTNKWLSFSGERVLCVLPKTPRTAQFFQLTPPEIQLLAPQVIWTIYYRCASHAIRTQEQLAEALEGWNEYVDPRLLFLLDQRLEKRHPDLLTGQSRQLLLP